MDDYTPADMLFDYMWYIWDYDRMCEIFGKYKGNSIAARWAELVQQYGNCGAVGVLYKELTYEERDKLWGAIRKYYSEPDYIQYHDGRD